MKKFVEIMVAVLVMAMTVKAESASNTLDGLVKLADEREAMSTEENFSFLIEGSYLSKYVGPSGVRYTDGETAQVEATVSYSSGISLTTWISKGFNSEDRDSDEIDVTVGWEGEMSLKDIKLPVSVGVGYYNFVRNTDDNVVAVTLEFSKENKLGKVFTFTGREYVEVVVPTTGSASFYSSFLCELGFELKAEIMPKGSIFLAPTIVYDGGEYGADKRLTARVELGEEFVIGGLTVRPSITHHFEGESETTGEDVFVVRASYDF